MKNEILMVWGSWRQVGGGVRYALDTPAQARKNLAELRRDPAMADALGAAVIVKDHAGRLTAWEWPGRSAGARPPWAEIHAALGIITPRRGLA